MLTYTEAINEAMDLLMEQDGDVILVGEGVPDPKGIWGSTEGLQEKFGKGRVMDMPLSEEAMTGAMVGTAITGGRPILTHQRVDFALLSLNQVVNNAAKWHFIFNGQMDVPLVIRMSIGMGWGQGAQHSQSLHSWFGHIPGLKVVMPATPVDAKGLLITSVRDNDPVIFLEHRWLHDSEGPVPEGDYEVPIGRATRVRTGNDATIVASSYMVVESLKAVEALENSGVDVELLDIRSIKPYDLEAVLESVRKTGNLLVVDGDWPQCGFASEVVTAVVENGFDILENRPRRLTWPDSPVPSSPALSKHFYPRDVHIGREVAELLDLKPDEVNLPPEDPDHPLDVPDPSFEGPF